MDCIPYINDLKTEIQILKDVKANGNCDIDNINKQIEEKENLIDKCKDNLSKLSDKNIEYRIYLNILNGMNVNKAISKVAEENFQNDIKPTTERAIYKYYYSNLKKIINIQ